MQEQDSLPVGIVLERRRINNPWQDFQWRTIGIIPGAARIDRWLDLRRGDGWNHFHAGTLTVRLFGRETQGYMVNLANTVPACYVILRQGEDAGDHDVEPFHATLCPFEAQSYLDAGEDIVDAVAMDTGMAAWLRAFCDRNHKDEPFYKRKRRNHTDAAERGPRRPPAIGRR